MKMPYLVNLINALLAKLLMYSLSFEVFRRAQEPSDKSRYDKSYFNLLIEYNSTLARRQLPGTFEYLQVGATEKKYPGLRVSYLHSSIFLAPKCHCDPNAYFYDDDLARKTVDAHLYINGLGADLGCEGGGKYQKGIRWVKWWSLLVILINQSCNYLCYLLLLFYFSLFKMLFLLLLQIFI